LRKYVLGIGEREYSAEVKEISTETAVITVNDVEYKINLKDIGRQQNVIPEKKENLNTTPTIQRKEMKEKIQRAGNDNNVYAPLPGLITDILVSESSTVKSGQTIALMEAMKMENQIQATHDGTVKKISVKKGDSVMEGDVILEIERSVITSL